MNTQIDNPNDVEVWRDIPGYEGLYEVSNWGQVRRCNGHVLKQDTQNYGYKRVFLYRDAVRKGLLVHRLVMLAFVGTPLDDQQVNHIDLNTANNHIDNLEYIDNLGNIRHAIALRGPSHSVPGEKNPFAKLSELDVIEIKRLLKKGYTSREIAQMFNVHRDTIGLIKNNKTWRHIV